MSRLALVVWVVICTLQVTRVQAGGIDDGLVSYHRFDGTLLDLSANAHDGVATAGATPTFVAGFSGLAAHFDGVDDAVRFPTIPNSVFGGDFSIAWFMKIDRNRLNSLIGKRDSCTVSNHFDVRSSTSNPSQVRFELSRPGQNATAVGANLPLGQWVHIAVVRRGDSAWVYTDGAQGVAVALPSLDFSSINAALGISTSPCIVANDGTRFFDGDLDELRVYQRALSEGEIQQLAGGGGVVNGGDVTATPTTTGAGGQIVLAAPTGFTSPAQVFCQARLGLGGTLLGDVSVDPVSGNVLGEVLIPTSTASGDHLVVLECGNATTAPTVIGYDTINVTSPISLTLDDSTAYAGQAVAFSAQNVTGRSIELWFAGQRIHGPVAVTDGQAAGIIGLKQLPTGFQPPFSGMLEARGRNGRLITSTGETAFTQIVDPGYRVRLDSISMPTSAPPETAFTISGRIGVSSGSPRSRTINVFFRGVDGRVTPLGARDVITDEQGQFSLQIELPSNATLDAYVAQGQGEIFFTFTEFDPLTGTVRTITEVAGPLDAIGYASPPESARIEVVVTGDTGGFGTPLAGAYVVIGGGNSQDFFDDDEADAGMAVYGPVNQYSRNRLEVGTYRACPVNLAAGYTDAQGVFSAQLDANQVREWILRRGSLLRGVCSTDINAPNCVTVQSVEASVEVYTAQLGFGIVQDGAAVNYTFPAEFQPSQVGLGGQFFDPNTGQALNSQTEAWRIPVLAPPITPAVSVIPYRRRTSNDGPGRGVEGDNYLKLRAVGNGLYEPEPARQFDIPNSILPCTVTPRPDPCVDGLAGEGLEITYFHDSNIAGDLQPGFPRLVTCNDGSFNCPATGNNTLPLSLDLQQPVGALACESGLQRYAVTLPTTIRTPNDPKLRSRIEVNSIFDPPGSVPPTPLQGKAKIQLTLEPMPEWFYDPQGQETLHLTERTVTRNPNGSLTFQGHEDLTDDGRGDPGRDMSPSSNEFTAVNLASPQKNATRSGRDLYRTQMNRSEALFEAGSNLNTENDVANNAARPISPSANSLRDPATQALSTEEIIDTGRLPLFRFTYGLPPIAAATLGADFWLQAGVSYGGIFDPESEVPKLTFVTEPYSRFGVDLFFDLSAIGGLVSATAEASARAYLSNRARYSDGEFTADAYQCFGLSVDVTLEICALLCTSIGDNLVSVYEARPANTINTANCSGSTQNLPGFPLEAPPPGSLPLNAGTPTRPALHPLADSSLAYDLQGRGAMMYVDAAGRLMRDRLPLCNSNGCREVVESVGAAVTSTATAALGAGGGITLWSFVPGNPASTDAATAQQHIRWVRYSADGTTYLPQNLTPPGSGDGSVVVGVCPAGLNACPAGGEVTAVWLRRLGQSWDDHHYALMYSRYLANNGWTPPQRIDTAQGQASDLQPTVAYRTSTGTPIVVWVRKPTSGLGGLEQRQIAYRFLDGSSPVRFANGLPAAVSWPSATTRFTSQGQVAAEQLVLAYTVNVDPVSIAGRAKAFVGNTNALNVATCILGGDDTCNFSNEQLRDRYDRNLRAEKPNVIADGSGTLAVAFNGLGFGPDAQGNTQRASDPAGMLSGHGDLVMVRPRLDGGPVTLLDLDVASLGAFKNALGFNPVLDNFEMISQPIDIGINGSAALAEMRRSMGIKSLTKGSANGLVGGMRVASLGAGADFRMESLTSAQSRLSPGGMVEIEASVRNLGRAYEPIEADDLQLIATWDGPEGSSAPVLVEALPALGVDQAILRTLQIPVPAEFGENETHALVLSVRAAVDAGESDTSDNARSVVFGSLPGATEIKVSYEPGEPMVYLSWQSEDPDDQRVSSWRVMRVMPNGDRVRLGSTPVLGFVDLSASFDETRQYVVVAYTDNGLESAESEIVQAKPLRRAFGGDVIFADGFESPR